MIEKIADSELYTHFEEIIDKSFEAPKFGDMPVGSRLLLPAEDGSHECFDGICCDRYTQQMWNGAQAIESALVDEQDGVDAFIDAQLNTRALLNVLMLHDLGQKIPESFSSGLARDLNQAHPMLNLATVLNSQLGTQRDIRSLHAEGVSMLLAESFALNDILDDPDGHPDDSLPTSSELVKKLAKPLTGATLIVSMEPCLKECLPAAVNKGVSAIKYLIPRSFYEDRDIVRRARLTASQFAEDMGYEIEIEHTPILELQEQYTARFDAMGIRRDMTKDWSHPSALTIEKP